VDDVTRQAAEAEWEFGGEKQERACGGQDEAEDQEGTAQLAGFHWASLEKMREKAKGAEVPRPCNVSVELDQIEAWEEVTDLEVRGVGGIGAVGTIVADAGAEVVPDGAGRSFFRIGGAHGVPPSGDGAIGLQDHSEDFAAGHEVGEFAEEGAGFVDGVEASGFFLREAHGFDGDDVEAELVDARENFALLIAAYGIGFDDCEGAFESHEEFPPRD
jgi:hypothetical protein